MNWLTAAHKDPLIRAIRLLDVRWSRVVRAVTFGSLGLGSAVGLAAVSAWLIARASQRPDIEVVSVAVVAVRAFGIGRGVFRYLERLASHDVALRGMSNLRTNLYIRLAGGRTSTLVGLRRGDLLTRVGTDVDAVGDVVVRSLIPIGVAIVLCTGSIVLVGAFLPLAALTLAACMLLTGVLAPLLALRAARASEQQGSRARAAISATVLESLESAGPLAVAGRIPSRMDALRGLDRDWAKATDAGARISGLAAALTTGPIVLASLASLVVGIPAVQAGTLAPVELSVIVLVPLAAFEAVSALPAAAIQWQRSRIAAQRIVDLFDDATSAVVEPTGEPERASADEPPTPAVVEAVNLCCAWPDSGGKPVLTGVDLRLAPGRALAVVGPSGIGKTTLMTTMAGLIPPVGGSVEFGRSPKADTLSREIVFVAEDGHIFDTSVLENLRVANGELDVADARSALVTVGLEDWLAGLPDGLDTILGPDATTISGGERRRILIARALVAPATLVCVDEPAEHLDPAAADALMDVLVDTAHQEGRGVLVATHRLSALSRMDEVILLGHPFGDTDQPATVLARGRHEELLSREEYRWALDQEVLV